MSDHYPKDLSDEQRAELVEHRGGCTCFLHPPCFNCSEPITMYEANELEWITEEEFEEWVRQGDPPTEIEQAVVKEFVYANPNDWAEPIDYMKAVRDMCR